MRYEFERKRGVVWLLMSTLVAATLTYWQGEQQLWGRSGATDWLLIPAVYVLLAGLMYRKYFLIRAIRTDEHGLTVERLGLPDLQVPWMQLTVSQRAPKRRGAAGLVLERAGDEEPYFLLLQGMIESEDFIHELQRRLGKRYRKKEGNKSDGTGEL